MSAGALQRMFDINVFGSMVCAREAVRRMSTRHGGRGWRHRQPVVGGGRLGSPGQYVDYAAAKGAIDTFTLGLAREVAAEGVRVNACVRASSTPRSTPAAASPTAPEGSAPLVPMQRAGSADEVAAAVVWLLSTRPATPPARCSTSPAAAEPLFDRLFASRGRKPRRA
jgi:NAD(P)-dependent dehydrogenase (short-subunit alcohol dehydrogenase family)